MTPCMTTIPDSTVYHLTYTLRSQRLYATPTTKTNEKSPRQRWTLFQSRVGHCSRTTSQTQTRATPQSCQRRVLDV
eukprot:6476246-Amphidinium_carterae.7